MENNEARLMTFSEILNGLKAGRKYQRKGWAGKGLYVQIHCSIPAVSLAGETKYIDKFFVIVNGERVNTWVPSVSDLLAEDWIEVF